MGNSSTKIGRREEKHISRCNTGEWNDKDDRMAAMVEINKLFVGNIWFF